jgi:integrase
MAEQKRIGLREVRALGRNQEVWDAAVPGFGARRRAGEAISYVLMFRTAEGRLRRFTIGRHGAPWTPETARAEARRLLGEKVKGADPAAEKQERRKALTVGELCDAYWQDVTAGRVLVRGGKPKKPLTLASDRGRIEGHIKPLLGTRTVAALARADVERFMHQVAAGESAARRKTKPRGLSLVRGGRGVATRTIGLLGAILSYAIEMGLRPDNPAHRIRKFAEGKREKRMSDDEYAALGAALRKAEANDIWPAAIACARFLALTGWRRGEALALRWQEIDLTRRTAILDDTKTGRSMRPLAHAACDLLRAQPRMGELVFPPTRGERGMNGFFKLWRRIARLGELPADITPHVLRHSFASVAADLGYSEPTIAALIGHKGHSITSRYVHSADAVLLAAADAVAQHIAELMSEAPATGEVIELRRA